MADKRQTGKGEAALPPALSAAFDFISGDDDSSALRALLLGPRKGGPRFWSGLSVALLVAGLFEILLMAAVSLAMEYVPRGVNAAFAVLVPLTLGAALGSPWITTYMEGRRRRLAVVAMALTALLCLGVIWLSLMDI